MYMVMSTSLPTRPKFQYGAHPPRGVRKIEFHAGHGPPAGPRLTGADPFRRRQLLRQRHKIGLFSGYLALRNFSGRIANAVLLKAVSKFLYTFVETHICVSSLNDQNWLFSRCTPTWKSR